MRPIYERKTDRERERIAIDAVLAHKSHDLGVWTAAGTPRLYAYDFEVSCGGRPTALVEVKVRTNEIGKYPTYMVSETKVSSLLREARLRGLSAWLVVEWADALGVIEADVAKSVGRVSYGGRYDRNDPLDVEQVLLIPTDKFTRIK